MTLGDYYNKKHYIDRTGSILKFKNTLRNTITTAKKNSSDIQKIEDFYQDILYNRAQNQDANYKAQYEQRLSLFKQAFIEEFSKFVNVDIANGLGPSDLTTQQAIEKIQQLKRDVNKHSTEISLRRINNRINHVENNFKQIPERMKASNLYTPAEIEQTINEIEELEQLLNTMRSWWKGNQDAEDGRVYISSKAKRSIAERMDTLYFKYAIKKLEDDNISFTDLGNFFEYFIAFMGAEVESIKEDAGEQLINEFKKMITGGNPTTGNKTQVLKNKSNKDIDSNIAIQFKNDFEDRVVKVDGKDKIMTFFNFNIPREGGGEEKLSFQYSKNDNPDSPRKGKADVVVNLKFGDYKISAKNWGDFTRGFNIEQDFGKTNIYYALARTMGDSGSIMEQWLYLLQDEGYAKHAGLEEVHRIAKISIMLDILMGYSQRGEGKNADIVLINNRAKRKVICFSTYDVALQMMKDMTPQIDGYDSATISKTSIGLRYFITHKLKTERSKTYQRLAQKYLQSIMVELKFSNVKKYITSNNLQSIS